MAGKALAPIRKQVLESIQGSVLEIGFGTGLNLNHYSSSVTHLTVLDNNQALSKLANQRIQNSSIPIKSLTISGENIPLEKESFDHIVCTWTLCSIKNVEQALSEIYRVLKPNGQFHFVEHGLSPNKLIQKIQYRLNPLQNLIGDGCNINRDIKNLIINAGFDLEEFKTYYMAKTPAILGYFYQGVAIKTEKRTTV